jgi:hypothetical protein
MCKIAMATAGLAQNLAAFRAPCRGHSVKPHEAAQKEIWQVDIYPVKRLAHPLAKDAYCKICSPKGEH